MILATNIPKTFEAGRILSPIPLLAFLGTTVESIVGIIAYTARNHPAFPILATGLILLPILLILLIYRLITKHHAKLYSPDQFGNQKYFLDVLDRTSKQIERVGKGEDFDIFKPLGHDARETELKDAEMRSDLMANISPVKDFLKSIDKEDFEVFHSWFNFLGHQDDLALMCIDLAIAKGNSSSRNYSYRSASLRKLGRLIEALHSSEIAVELAPPGSEEIYDALYNLARINLEMERTSQVRKILDFLQSEKQSKYAERLDYAIFRKDRLEKIRGSNYSDSA